VQPYVRVTAAGLPGGLQRSEIHRLQVARIGNAEQPERGSIAFADLTGRHQNDALISAFKQGAKHSVAMFKFDRLPAFCY
jgi:hypothetical protein